MDRVIYYNKDLDFVFGLSMILKNVVCYESINNENLKGWYIGVGMFYLYNSDVKYYCDNFWVIVDMKCLLGIIILDNEILKDMDDKKLSKIFVGGIKIDD